MKAETKLIKTEKVTECPLCHSKELEYVEHDPESIDMDPILAPHFIDGYKCKQCDCIVASKGDDRWYITMPTKGTFFTKTSDYGSDGGVESIAEANREATRRPVGF